MDLLGQPDSWTYGAEFNADTKSASDYLTKYMRVALDDVTKNGQNSRYADFVAKVQDKNWNGILALNVHIPPAALPEELQGLKSGLGDLNNLRAYHVDIEINDVKNMQLSKSSLFALIDYENPGPPPSPDKNGYSFFVPTLQISFANSAINYFHCEVDVGLGSFFGEKSTQQSESRMAEGAAEDDGTVIKVFGTCQNHDGESVYSFVTDEEYDFNFPGSTFLKTLTLNKVQFSTTTVENGGDNVKSTLSFWGSLSFNVLGGSKSSADKTEALEAADSDPALDPFSFSKLSFADLSLSMSYLNTPEVSFGGTGEPTGGTFKLGYGGQTTAAIAYNAAASDIQTALEALSNIGAGNVTSAGGPLPAAPVGVICGATPVSSTLTGDGSQLSGGAFTVNTSTVSSTKFAFNPGDIRFDLGSSSARSSSFLSRLPLKLKTLM